MIRLTEEYIELVNELKKEPLITKLIENFRFGMFIKSKYEYLGENMYTRVIETYELENDEITYYNTIESYNWNDIEPQVVKTGKDILGYVGIREIQQYLRIKWYKTNYTHKGKLETYQTGSLWELIVHIDPLEPIYSQNKVIQELLSWIKYNIK